MIYNIDDRLPVEIDTSTHRRSQFNKENNEVGLKCVVDPIDEITISPILGNSLLNRGHPKDIIQKCPQGKCKRATSCSSKFSCQLTWENCNITGNVHTAYVKSYHMELTNSRSYKW